MKDGLAGGGFGSAPIVLRKRSAGGYFLEVINFGDIGDEMLERYNLGEGVATLRGYAAQAAEKFAMLEEVWEE